MAHLLVATPRVTAETLSLSLSRINAKSFQSGLRFLRPQNVFHGISTQLRLNAPASVFEHRAAFASAAGGTAKPGP
jgi:hypothetical protein